MDSWVVWGKNVLTHGGIDGVCVVDFDYIYISLTLTIVGVFFFFFLLRSLVVVFL